MADHIRPAGVFDTNYEQDIAINRTRFERWRSWIVLGFLLLLPMFTRDGLFAIDLIRLDWISLINKICIFVIAAQGLNILVGYAGQISLGHAAFMAVGAYSGGLLAKGFVVGAMQFGPYPFWIAIPAAALITGVVGLIFGLPSLRVKGFYLAMATLAAQFIIPWVIANPLEGWTNAPSPLQGIPAPNILGFSFSSSSEMFYIIVPLTALLLMAARNIIRSRIGRAFISVRDNDLAAELLGINVFTYKLQAFFLSALYAGIAGALLALERNSISLDTFTLDQSIILLAMLVIGGAGFPMAAVFGVTFVEILEGPMIQVVGPLMNNILPTILPFIAETNISASLRPLIVGIALMLFLIFEPRGLAYRWEIFRIAWKIRPYSY